jgi:hypothetical protein
MSGRQERHLSSSHSCEYCSQNRDHFADGEIPGPQITGIPEGDVPIFQIAELVTCEGIQGPKITSHGPEAVVDIL